MTKATSSLTNFTIAAGFICKRTCIQHLRAIFSLIRPEWHQFCRQSCAVSWLALKSPPKVPRERGASAPGAVWHHGLTSSQTLKHVKWWNATGGEKEKFLGVSVKTFSRFFEPKATSSRILETSKSPSINPLYAFSSPGCEGLHAAKAHINSEWGMCKMVQLHACLNSNVFQKKIKRKVSPYFFFVLFEGKRPSARLCRLNLWMCPLLNI